MSWLCLLFFFFFFNDTATTEIYTLSLHDALPFSRATLSARFASAATMAATRSRSTPSPCEEERRFPSFERTPQDSMSPESACRSANTRLSSSAEPAPPRSVIRIPPVPPVPPERHYIRWGRRTLVNLNSTTPEWYIHGPTGD